MNDTFSTYNSKIFPNIESSIRTNVFSVCSKIYLVIAGFQCALFAFSIDNSFRQSKYHSNVHLQMHVFPEDQNQTFFFVDLDVKQVDETQTRRVRPSARNGFVFHRRFDRAGAGRFRRRFTSRTNHRTRRLGGLVNKHCAICRDKKTIMMQRQYRTMFSLDVASLKILINLTNKGKITTHALVRSYLKRIGIKLTNLFLRYDYQSGQKNDLENISFVCAATFESGTNPSLSKRLSARFNGTVMLHPSEDSFSKIFSTTLGLAFKVGTLFDL